MNRYRVLTSLLWICALALFAWTLQQMPLASILDTMGNLTFSQWVLFLLLNGAVLLILTQRWRTLIHMQQHGDQQLSAADIFLIRQAGQCISFITPGPQFGGEPFQLYWLWKRSSLPLHKGFLSLALDRFMDLWVNFAVLLAAACYLLFSMTDIIGAPLSARIVLLLSMPLVVLSTLLWVLLRRPGWLTASLRRMISRWRESDRLSRLSTSGADHWRALQTEWESVRRQKRPALAGAFGLTLLGWAAVMAELWLLLSFVGVQPGLTSFLMILLAIRMAMLLPLPAGIGTIEAGILWTFQNQGFDVTSAMGLIALMRLRDAAILLLGMLCLKLLPTVRVGSPPSRYRSPTA